MERSIASINQLSTSLAYRKCRTESKWDRIILNVEMLDIAIDYYILDKDGSDTPNPARETP